MLEKLVTLTHLPVLLQVGPHARPVPPSHQDMVGEVVDAGQRTRELACTRLIVVPHVGHHVVELQDLAALVLLPEAGVESDFRRVEGGAITVGSGPRWTRWTGLTGLSRWTFGTWGPRKSGAASEALFTPPV